MGLAGALFTEYVNRSFVLLSLQKVCGCVFLLGRTCKKRRKNKCVYRALTGPANAGQNSTFYRTCGEACVQIFQKREKVWQTQMAPDHSDRVP